MSYASRTLVPTTPVHKLGSYLMVTLLILFVFATFSTWIQHYAESMEAAGVETWESLPAEVKRNLLRDPWVQVANSQEVEVNEPAERRHEKRRQVGKSRTYDDTLPLMIEALDHPL